MISLCQVEALKHIAFCHGVDLFLNPVHRICLVHHVQVVLKEVDADSNVPVGINYIDRWGQIRADFVLNEVVPLYLANILSNSGGGGRQLT